MRSILPLLLSIFCLLFCGCKEKSPQTEDSFIEREDVVIIRLNLPAPKDTKFETKDILPYMDSIHYVRLELTDNSIIGSMDKVEIYNDRIYILDTQSSALFVFDMTGNFLFKIHNIGNGPEEYIQLDFFDIDRKQKQIVLTDLMSYHVMRFDLNGNYISRQKIPFWNEGAGPIPEKGVALFANFRDNKKLNPECNLICLDSLMQVEQCHFLYNSSDYASQKIRFSTPQRDSFWNGPDGRLNFQYFNEIYQVSSNKLNLSYLFDFGKYSFDKNHLQHTSELKEYLKKGDYYELFNFVETNDLIAFGVSSPSFPMLQIGFYSKESENIIFYPAYSFGETESFSGIFFKCAYNSYIVSEISADGLLSWKANVEERKLKLKNKELKQLNFELEKEELKQLKQLADKLTIDDNSILMFYKLKPF